MCHGHRGRRRERTHTADDSEETEEEVLPPFLNEDDGEGFEVLTDGGDET